MSETNPWDHQESGSHYKKFKIQPAYFCYVNNIGFLVGNVIKYILRDKENKLEDLKKAKHYLELLIYEEEARTSIQKTLECCPACGSGDVRWCSVSHRPYCFECNHWGAVNFGSDEDAINKWNKRS